MNLHEALKGIPGDTILRNHVNGKLATAAEVLVTVKDEIGYEVSHSRRNYGRDEYVTIYVPGIGVVFSQV